MRFMIMVKATKDTEAGKFPENAEKLFDAMAAYHDELVKAGVLLDASGLQPSAAGWKIKYSGEKRSVIDGPFTEAKELIAGYTLIQTKTREEALEWTKRFPKPHLEQECEIEVRQLYELDDFETIEAAKEAIGKFRTMDAKLKQ
ncbi:MAG TPA: YciI family protein [Dongiaceae bacterium]|nr:YciI family protein [Dongiaceae bacterium]